MKTLMLRTLVTLCVSGWLMSAAAQVGPNGAPEGAPEPGMVLPPPDNSMDTTALTSTTASLFFSKTA
jgi:hypothetical protein